MNNDSTYPYAIWFLRLTLAIALLAHVELNLVGSEPPGAAHWLGLPLGVSLFGMTLEFVTAMALMIGVWPRIAALAGAGIVFGAIITACGPAIFRNPGFDWTGPVIWMGALILLSLLGDGAFVLVPTDSESRKENRP